MKQTLSPKDLAEAIGVSESSLKRWADDGRIRVHRTVGGHRRIALQEAVRFAREANLPVHRPEVLGLAEVSRARAAADASRQHVTELLAEKLKRGLGEEARAIILDLYLSGKSVAYICDEPIRRAMEDIGRIWKHTPEGIVVEHRATDICIQSLNVLRHLIERPDSFETDGDNGRPTSPVAVGGAPSADPYLLPSIMITCMLSEVGYKAHNLGPDTPLKTLSLTVETYLPKIVWLSCSADAAVPSRSELDALRGKAADAGAQVVVGGRAAEEVVPASNLHVFPNLAEFSSFAKGLLTGVAAAPAAG